MKMSTMVYFFKRVVVARTPAVVARTPAVVAGTPAVVVGEVRGRKEEGKEMKRIMKKKVQNIV